MEERPVVGAFNFLRHESPFALFRNTLNGVFDLQREHIDEPVVGNSARGQRRQANERQEHERNSDNAPTFSACRVQRALLRRKLLARKVGKQAAQGN